MNHLKNGIVFLAGALLMAGAVHAGEAFICSQERDAKHMRPDNTCFFTPGMKDSNEAGVTKWCANLSTAAGKKFYGLTYGDFNELKANDFVNCATLLNRLAKSKPAVAANTSQRGDRYLAIAFSTSTGTSEMSWGDNQSRVNTHAVSTCNEGNRAHDCKLLFQGKNICGSIVGARNPNGTYYASWQTRPNRNHAQDVAMSVCKSKFKNGGCELLGTTCASDPND
jgi:hypothetical protein